MTLPMVTCPLCCRPGFSSSDSLCTALVDATTRKLSCPICNHEVSGLDKFTIHLFSHYLSRLGYLKSKDTSQINTEPAKTNFDNNRFNMIICNDKNQNSNYDTDKLRNIINNEETVRPVEKQDSLVCNNLTVKNSKSIPNDPSLIYFRSDNGQLFALSQENLGTNLKNVTINTQNYITSTNITTSTVQTNLIGNIQKRKYCQIIDKDSSFKSTKCVDMEGGSPEELINNESTHSWTSVPSNSSDIERSTTNENKFESCKDLLTKGDFSTNNDELNDLKTIDSNVENKNNENQIEKENKLKENTSCNLCSYIFPNKIILAMHNQLIHKKNETEIESKRKLLLCNQCPRTFNLRSSLMIHRKVAHAGGFGNTEGSSKQQQTQNLTCQMCGKFFNKDVHLTQHMKVHDEKQWQCSICAKGFTTKYFLKKHRRLHTGEMPYRCKTCSKSFTFQQTYRKHLLYHNNDKPYCCAQCGRLFKELSTLHNHERIHSGEKPFSCETCGKSFRQRVSYLVHRRIHTGAMPYKCTACNKSFRYKISQRTHKCTAQPPGVVVRTQGYLVHRLQAAMNKAAEINGCNSPEKNLNTNGDTGISAATIHAEPGKSNPTLLVPESLTTSEDNNITTNNGKLIKTADLPKMKVDKPQIYLLVRGPNGETYYQPLILSSQNVLTNSSPTASTQNGIYLQTNKTEAVPSKCSKLSVDKQNNDDNKSNLQNFNNILDKKSTILTNEINPNEGNNISFGNTENKTDDKVNNLLHTENIYQETNETTMKISGENNVSISTSSLMSDLFNNLEFDNEIIKADNTPCNINKNLSTNNQNNNTDNNSDSIMDSSDLFSFMLSPSLSSPSDRFGRLSLSPNSSINNSLNSDNYGNNSSPNINNSSLNNPPSLGDQQDVFFENMSDDTLKELLFGSVK